MPDVKLLNLDQLAANTSQAMVEQTISALKQADSKLKQKEAAEAVDNLVTKALGVLQENGIYAGMLFLLSRTSKKDQTVSAVVQKQLLKSLKDLPFELHLPGEKTPQRVLEFYANRICDDLDMLFLVKELYEQTLIYARYGAKAAKESSQAQDETSS